MAGQGFHFGGSSLILAATGREVTESLVAGNLGVDAWNKETISGRRASHFCGGAGCICPTRQQLRQPKIQSWDSELEKSYAVDPMIDMELFEASNKHLPEDDYKNGIRLHLLSDMIYDHFVQDDIFDFSEQKNDIITVRSTGIRMSSATFRKEIYSLYPMLDQYMLNLAGVTAQDIEEIKELLRSIYREDHADFVIKYLKFDSKNVWRDSCIFKKKEVNKFIDTMVSESRKYLNW